MFDLQTRTFEVVISIKLTRLAYVLIQILYNIQPVTWLNGSLYDEQSTHVVVSQLCIGDIYFHYFGQIK